MSSAEMRVRSARPDDLAAVVGLLHEDAIREVDESEVSVPAYGEAFAKILDDPHHDLLVGELGDGRVVATAQVTWLRRLTYVGGLVCLVESVRVRSDLRGRGLGGELMRSIEQRARDRGVARVELTTNAQRVRARTFYEDLGYVASHVGMKLYLEGVR